MKKKLIFAGLLCILSMSLQGQILISPYSVKKPSDKLAPTGTSNEFGFWPFSGKNRLQVLYDSSSAFNALERFAFTSLINTSGNNPTTFVEVASFVDPGSAFKVDLSVQLTDTEANDTTNSPQNVAIQKLMSEGGNISLGINRPIYYNQAWSGNYFLTEFGVNAFFDLPFVNKKVYNPSLGAQLRLSGDIRLYTNSGENKRISGKLFRAGVEYGAVWNVFNSEYQKNSELPELPGSVGFITIEPYVGLLFFNIKYTGIISSNDIFNGKKSIIEVGIVPIKF